MSGFADHTFGGQGDGRFATTHWSMVLDAKAGSSKDADRALEELCRIYWYPLYAFARRAGHAPEVAQDFTQDFFQQLLEKRMLDSVQPSKGKFRSFLLASFKNLITSEFRKAGAQKRGGGQMIVSLDEKDPESRYQREPQDPTTPEQLYDRGWAQTLVNRAISALKNEWEEQGKPFETMKVFLLGGRGVASFGDVARELGVTEGALKITIHRMRRRYGELFRREVAMTVADPSEVDEEMHYLIGTLGN